MSDYKLVPVEPTTSMVHAAMDAAPIQEADAYAVYDAIRAAAPDHIPDAGIMVADQLRGDTKKIGRPQIREVFMRNGASIPADRDDLPDYVYESVFELLEMAAPAVRGEPVAWQRVDRPERIVTTLSRRTWQETNDGVGFIPLYTAPQPAEQKPFEWPLLDAPALIGGVVVGKGCSSGHVVMIAQRKYQYEAEHSPEEHARRKKAFQDALAQIRDGVGQQPAEQKPANPDDTATAILVDRMYIAGLKAGWNYAEAGDRAGFGLSIENGHREIREAKQELAEQQPAPDVAGLVEALEAALGSFDDWCEGQDPSDIADAIDTFPWVMQARAALAAQRKQGGEAPVSPAAKFPDCEMECGAYGSYCRCADESKEPSHDNQ